METEFHPQFGGSLRELPGNPQVEQALLGAILANPKALLGVAEQLRPEHFVDAMHGRIYQEAARRILAGGMADAVTLKEWFRTDPEGAKDEAYLVTLLAAMVGVSNAPAYADLIRDSYSRRQVIAAASGLAEAAYDVNLPIEKAVLDGMAQVEQSIARDLNAGREHIAWDAAMREAVIAADVARVGGRAGLSTGMSTVDAVIGGLEPGTLSILGGRAGVGKTSLGYQWVIHIARELRAKMAAGGEQRSVAAVSLEMPARALARRALAAASQVSVSRIKSGQLSDADEWAIAHAEKELKGLPLYVMDAPGMTAPLIRLRLRALQRKQGPLAMVIVDHLHLVRTETKDARNPAWAVGQVSLALLEIAKEFDIPVLALAQLSRGGDGREDHRPVLSDLRWAGDIEQNADCVMFVYREDYQLAKSSPPRKPSEKDGDFADRVGAWHARRREAAGKAELICAKVRDGEPRNIAMRFDGSTTSFAEQVAGDDPDQPGW